jgi:hypothetical protein
MELDLKKIEETPHLQDMLIEIEDVLDSLDIYVFRNWIKGEIVKGPTIRRYWVDVILMYLDEEMPDPKGGLRLLKHGVMVKFRKDKRIGAKGVEVDVWYVELEVPRKLINGMNDASTDYYDDEIDIDDVDSAIDLGVDDKTGTEGSLTHD